MPHRHAAIITPCRSSRTLVPHRERAARHASGQDRRPSTAAPPTPLKTPSAPLAAMLSCCTCASTCTPGADCGCSASRPRRRLHRHLGRARAACTQARGQPRIARIARHEVRADARRRTPASELGGTAPLRKRKAPSSRSATSTHICANAARKGWKSAAGRLYGAVAPLVWSTHQGRP